MNNKHDPKTRPAESKYARKRREWFEGTRPAFEFVPLEEKIIRQEQLAEPIRPRTMPKRAYDFSAKDSHAVKLRK